MNKLEKLISKNPGIEKFFNYDGVKTLIGHKIKLIFNSENLEKIDNYYGILILEANSILFKSYFTVRRNKIKTNELILGNFKIKDLKNFEFNFLPDYICTFLNFDNILAHYKNNQIQLIIVPLLNEKVIYTLTEPSRNIELKEKLKEIKDIDKNKIIEECIKLSGLDKFGTLIDNIYNSKYFEIKFNKYIKNCKVCLEAIITTSFYNQGEIKNNFTFENSKEFCNYLKYNTLFKSYTFPIKNLNNFDVNIVDFNLIDNTIQLGINKSINFNKLPKKEILDKIEGFNGFNIEYDKDTNCIFANINNKSYNKEPNFVPYIDEEDELNKIILLLTK